MGTELVVEHRQQSQEEACPERLDAVCKGIEQTDWDENPAEDGSISDGYTSRGYGTIAFVLPVLLNADDLVGYVKVEDV